MNKNILNLLDFNKVDALLDGFNKSTGFVTAILDLDGNVLSKSGWRQICTEFHRINPETSKKCTFSDTQLANKMIEGEKYHFYKCLNGLVDVAVPIVINGEHIANLFSGQFFFEEPDKSFFREQAAKYGFDEEKYLSALIDVPVVSKEKVKTVMDFLLNMTRMISEITFQKIEQTELNKTIRESEEKFRAIYENINDAVFIHKILRNGEPGNFLYFNSAAIKMLGYSSEELKSMSPRELDDPHNSRQYIPKVMKQLKEQRMSKFEAVQIAKDGRKIDMEVNAVVANIGGDDHIVSVCRDITEKKALERILFVKEQFLSAIYTGISQSIFVVDVSESGDFQYAGLNPQHEITTGISSDFIKGKKPEELLPKDAALDVCKRYAECVNLKQTIAFEEWLPFKGKHTCWETILNPRISESGNVYQIIGTSQEITERKVSERLVQEKNEEIAAQNEELNQANKELIKAKQKAEESEAKLNALFASMSEMVVLHELVFDKNGKPVNYRITDCNDAFIKITGISRNAAIGRLSTEVYGTEQPPYFNEYSKVALTGEPYHCETYFQPMDKHFSISVISPEKYRFATVTTDITGYKRAEEALQKSEDSLQAVLNSTADGILAVGKDNKVLYTNERFSELWRIPTDILEGGDDSILLQHILDQLSDPEGFLKKVQELYINDKESFDVINFHDGRIFERLSRPLSAKSEVKGRVWSFRDVTGRKKAEEEYLKFFTITEKALYGSAIADPDGNLVYVNDYFAHIHGYKAKELIGRKLDIFHSDAQMPLVRKTIEDALEKGSIESVEIHHLHKNGHEFPMLMSLVVIKDPDDKPNYIAATAFDLTEQKTAEQKLQNTVNEQNLMLDNDPTLIFFKDCKNNILRVTESVAKATGMTREEIEGRPSKEIYPDMADRYWEDDLEVIKSGKPKLNIIEPLTGADGSSHWLLTNKIPVKNNLGDILGVTVFATDITELKNSELGLIAAKDKAEESEQRFKSLIENAPDGVVIIDESGKFKYVSPNAGRLFGYNEDEGIGHSGDEYTHPDDLPLIQKTIETILADPGQKPTVQYRFKRKNGEFRWIDTTFTNLLSHKAINGIVLNFTDVTERKQIFEELVIAKEKTEESEERFNLAMKASNDGIFDWNLETNGVYYSPGWKKMLGYEDHELPNDFSVWETTTVPEDVKKSWELQQQLISKQIDRFEIEFKMQHKDGHWVDILSRAEAIFDDSGKAVRIVGTHTDITERRQAEAALKNRENLLNKVFDVLPIGLWFADANGRLIRGNPAGVKIWGAEPKVSIEEYGVFKARRHPSGKEIEPDDWALALTIRNGVTIGDEQLEIDTFDGKKKIILNYTAPVPDDQGNLQGAIVVNQDITERMKTEKALMMKMDELERYFKLTVGRELAMVELKKEVNNLLNKLGKDNKYKIVE